QRDDRRRVRQQRRAPRGVAPAARAEQLGEVPRRRRRRLADRGVLMATDIRLKKLERLALRRASEIVLHELADPRLTLVTVTRVELAADLSHGTIFWSTLGEGGQRSKVEHALRDAAPVVQSEIAKVFRTR